MRSLHYLLACCLLTLAACTNSFKKGDHGIEYKIISDGNGKKVEYGNFIQMHFTQTYKGDKDTLLNDSHDFMPRINILDSIKTPAEYFKILRQLRKGDSMVMRIRVDSFFKNQPDRMLPFMKKSDYIYTGLRIINIFETRAEADSANKAEAKIGRPKIFKRQLELTEKEVIAKNKAQLDADNKLITEYLAKNNIKASPTKWGTFVSIATEGTGENIKGSDMVTLNYTGRTLDSGRVFDSNIDPKFQHTTPYQLTIDQLNQVILGWTDGLMQLKKGSKATLYIPSTLGYGKDGRLPDIKPNDILVFDIEVLDVESEEQLLVKQEAQQKQFEEAQRKRMDSMSKAQAQPNKK